MNDDSELLRRYLDNHSEAAFTELVERHIGFVYSVALRQLNHDAHFAEDVAQTVFTALARKAGSLRHHATLTGWLYVSTHHAAAAVVRSERRRKRRELNAEITMSPVSPEDTADLQPELERAMVQLKAEDRDALVLRFFEQRSFADVGRLLRTSEDAARKRVDRALEKLRALLDHRGVTSSTAVVAAALTNGVLLSPPSGLASQIARHACANAAASAAPGGLTAALKFFPAAAAVAIGAWLVLSQLALNRTLKSEFDQGVKDRAAITDLRSENRRLLDRIREVDDLRRAAALFQAKAVAVKPSPTAAPTRLTFAEVRVTPQRTLLWNGTGLSLQDFIDRLKAAGADPSLADAKLVVQANDTGFDALEYVIDEARKARIKHLVIESNATPLTESRYSLWSWF